MVTTSPLRKISARPVLTARRKAQSPRGSMMANGSNERSSGSRVNSRGSAAWVSARSTSLSVAKPSTAPLRSAASAFSRSTNSTRPTSSLRRSSCPRTACALVDPAITPILRPPMPSKRLMPDSDLTSTPVLSANMRLEKSTSFMRESETDVDPHSMSAVPSAIAWKRLLVSTGTHLIASVGTPSWRSNDFAMRWQSSML